MTLLNRIIISALILFTGFSVTGCTSTFENATERLALNYTNQSAHIRCYSGGTLIYSNSSIGKVTDSPDSDGFFWKDENGFVETNANCIFTYK